MVSFSDAIQLCLLNGRLFFGPSVLTERRG